MISDETWDRYRVDQRNYCGLSLHWHGPRGLRLFGAIIAPPPPKSLVSRFFASYQITTGNEFSIIKVEAEQGSKRVRLAA